MRTRLHGIHHVPAITAEAQPNVDFYAGVLGLRLIKKTVGMVHETRWRVRNAAALDFWAARLTDAAIATERDGAIYFREPSGVLFEIATDAPGFLIDEAVESRGAALRLPPQFEARRAPIEARLRPLRSRRDVASHT